jgi:hypothetical protein
MAGIYPDHTISTPPPASASGSAVSFQEFVQGLQKKSSQPGSGDNQRPGAYRVSSQSSLVSAPSDDDLAHRLRDGTPDSQDVNPFESPFEDPDGSQRELSRPPSLAESFNAARPRGSRYTTRQYSGDGSQRNRFSFSGLDTDVETASSPLSGGPQSSTEYRGYSGLNEYTPQRSTTQVSRSKSILDRTKDKFKWRQRNDRYNTLHDVEEGNEQDVVGVDISSLGGPLELTDFQLTSQPSKATGHNREISEGQLSIGAGSSSSVEDITPLKSPLLSRGLGNGMKIGASFRVNAAAANVRRARSQNPQQPTDNTDLARAKTIRKIGQREAQQLGTIVAIDDAMPAVDLSTYEGMKRANTEESFDTIQTANDPNKQSYFYPEDPQQPNWKPFSMRKPYIIILIVISLVLAIVQEWLCQKSIRLAKKNRGLINFDRVSEVGLLDFIVWKYLPTLVFVIYGVLWQIMDYQTKRLEPYYQLSRPTGSAAAESLNIDYLTMWSNLAHFKAIQYR